jgi:hypothetical protein
MATEKQEVALEALNKVLQEHNNVGTIDLRELIDGEMKIMKSGKLRLPLSLPVEMMLPDQDIRHVINGNWKCVPVLMFLHPEDVRDADGNPIDIYADEEESE